LIQLSRRELELVLRRHMGENVMLDVQVDDGAPKKVLLQEVQHEPVTDALLHADFLEVSMTEKMRVGIPIVLIGEAPGVQEGGILEQLVRALEVDCLPMDLVEKIEVDVSQLHLAKSILVKELKLDPKLTVVTAGHIAVAIVAVPREEKEEEVAAVEGAAAEPELIGKEKKEGEEEEGEAPGKEKGGKAEKGEKAGKPEKGDKGGKPAPAEKGGKDKGKEKREK